MSAPLPMRRAGLSRAHEAASPLPGYSGERPLAGLTAGDRLVVSSSSVGISREGKRRWRGGLLSLVLVLVLIVFAGIGATTVYHGVAGALPH
jgi:hypothetical protein